MSITQKNPFSDIPSTLLSEIISLGGGLSEAFSASLTDILGKRGEFRQALESNSCLMKYRGGVEITETVCAVDACSEISTQLFSDFYACAAFAVEGLSGSGSEIHYLEPRMEHAIHADSRFEGGHDISQGILAEMKAELAADVPHAIVMYNGAADSDFYMILKSLPLAMRMKDTKTGAAFLSRLKGSLAAFRSFAAETSPAVIVTFPGGDYGNEITGKLGIEDGLAQDAVLTALLEPGEYTAPQSVAREDAKRASAVPIKDDTFAELRDYIVRWLDDFAVIYFRPQAWTRALRLEIPGKHAQNADSLAHVLGAVASQCTTAGFALPYPLYTAKKLTENFIEALPALCRASLDDISGKAGDRFSDILPLLLDSSLKKR